MLRAARLVLLMALVGIAARVLFVITQPALAELWRGTVHGTAPHSGWTLDRLVADLSAAVVWVCFASLVCSAALALALAAGQVRSPGLALVARCIGPAWWRHGVVAVCGMGLASTLGATPSFGAQSTGVQPAVSVSCPACPPDLSGLPLPDLPAGPRPTTPQPLATVVRPGDSLWAIVRDAAGPDVSDQQIAHRVARLYKANHRVIGPDPDLLIPGTKLTHLEVRHDQQSRT